MNVENIVSDVKARAEVVAAKGQEIVETGVEALKAANAVVVEGVQSLLQTNVAAGKDLLAAVQESLNKAKTDGIKAVATNPIAYVPEGKDRILAAYNDNVAVVSKTSDELVKALKQGYESLSAKLAAEQAAADASVVVEAAPKKTAKKGSSKKKAAASA